MKEKFERRKMLAMVRNGMTVGMEVLGRRAQSVALFWS